MTPEDYRAIQEAFLAIRSADPGDRIKELQQLQAKSADMALHVEKLLQMDAEDSSDFLELPFEISQFDVLRRHQALQLLVVGFQVRDLRHCRPVLVEHYLGLIVQLVDAPLDLDTGLLGGGLCVDGGFCAL